MQKYVTFAEKNPKKSLLKIKMVKQSEIIVITEVNKGVQYIVFVI